MGHALVGSLPPPLSGMGPLSHGVSTATICILFVASIIQGQHQQETDPVFLAALENHTVVQGRDVYFTCVVNHLGSYKVAWIKSDTKAILAIHNHMVAHNPRLSVTHNGHNTWKLHISNVQKNDSGTYMCQINTDPMRNRMGNLEVVVPPDILSEESSDDQMAREGGSVRLRCKATGLPEPRVYWRREDGNEIVLREENQATKRVKEFDGEVLQLNSVTRTDMGVYLCIAKNGIQPTVSKRFIVNVHFHPLIKVPNQLVVAPVNSNVIIECYVEASPKAMNSWYKDTGLTNNQMREKLVEGSKFPMEEVPQPNGYSLYMRLTIRNLEKKDYGSYVCSSANALGNVEGVIRLQELQLAPKTTIVPSPSRHNDNKNRRKEGKGRSKKRNKQGKERKGMDGLSEEESDEDGEGLEEEMTTHASMFESRTQQTINPTTRRPSGYSVRHGHNRAATNKIRLPLLLVLASWALQTLHNG